MSNLGILPPLTKDYIMSRISQEQIFEKYLGVPVVLDGVIKSPLRARDDDPSFSFYYSNNGKLRARDWAGYFWGDCFDVVGFILHVDSKDKKGFGVILDQIARDFRLHKYSDRKIESGDTTDIREANIRVKKITSITFQGRNWIKQDADFWKAGNITKAWLEIARVYPALYIWVNNNLIYNFNPKDPAYVYYFTPTDIKVYFPFRTKYRFIGNTSYLQGIDLLEPDMFGIIQKSYKDVISMKTFDLQAVASSSESTPISKDQWFKMKWTCNMWFSLLDFDRQGVVMTNKLRKLYPIQPLFFGNYHFPVFSNTHFKVFKNVKDWFDFVKHYGKEATFDLIGDVTYHFQKEVDNYDQYATDNLKFILRTKETNNEQPF